LRQEYAKQFAQKIESLINSNHYIERILKHAALNNGDIIIFDKNKVSGAYIFPNKVIHGQFDSVLNTIYISQDRYSTSVDYAITTLIHEATHKLISNKYHKNSNPYLLSDLKKAELVTELSVSVSKEGNNISKRLKLYDQSEQTKEILPIFVEEVVMKQNGWQHSTRTGTEEKLFELLDSTLGFQERYDDHHHSELTGVDGYWSVA
jgi:hypothetical protein